MYVKTLMKKLKQKHKQYNKLLPKNLTESQNVIIHVYDLIVISSEINGIFTLVNVNKLVNKN